MKLHLNDIGGHVIDFGGATLPLCEIAGHSKQTPDKPGVTIRNAVFRSGLWLEDCCQCTIEGCKFLDCGVTFLNVHRWSENNTLRDLSFIASPYAIRWNVAGGKRSFARQHVSNVFLARCVRGITCNGSVYGSRIEHVRGNFSDQSLYAFSIGGNMRATVIDGVDFEGGSDRTRLFEVRDFDQPAMVPTIRDAFYHGHEDQTGIPQ